MTIVMSLFVEEFIASIERCPDTQFYVAYVPSLPGAHSQGETINELYANLKEVVAMLTIA